MADIAALSGHLLPIDATAALEAPTKQQMDAGDAAAVPKALVDAKGDLLVGSAADTVARLVVGPDGQMPVADSTQTLGVKWARPVGSSPMVSGHYIGPTGIRGTAAMAASTEYAIPIWIGEPGTLDRIGCEVITAGTAGTVIRLGIRSSTTADRPGTLLLDAGTVAGDAVATAELTISLAIATPAVYWLTATAQSTGGTLPAVRVTQADRTQVYMNTLAQALGSSLTSGYVTSATVTGALGSTYTVANRSGIPAMVVVRAA